MCCQMALFVGINSYNMKQIIYSLGIFALYACGETKQKPEISIEERAKTIHEKVITIDTHDDINVKNFTDSIHYGQRLETQVNIPKMKEGGLDVAWLIVYTGQDTLTDDGYTKASINALGKFDAIHRLCEELASARRLLS